MTSRELKENHDRISDQIRSLNSELRDIENQMNVLRKERLSQLVGICYRLDNGDYIKVVGLPVEKPSMSSGLKMDPYELPVLVLPANPKDNVQSDTGLLPFYEDVVYSDACNADDPVQRFVDHEGHKTIPQQEFDARLETYIGDFLAKLSYKTND